MSDLSGKVALVTGASRSVGASVAQMLAAGGADVVINYLPQQETTRSRSSQCSTRH